MAAPALLRLTASGDVEEANAALGAAISTDGMAPELDRLLDGVQRDLLDLATELREPSATRADPTRAERLAAAHQRYARPATPEPGDHATRRKRGTGEPAHGRLHRSAAADDLRGRRPGAAGPRSAPSYG